ncbi:alkaline phosphatase family protein [Chloroflexota bacterium]
MTWSLRWIVDLFNALAAWYYRRKYGAAARQLGRLPQESDGRRGFVIIEIDGLAHHYLRQAIRQGYMPYLTRLILGRRLRLARWRCGLPSTTPASQAGIMYGNNWDIPGFRWYDKQTQSSIMCKIPAVVRAIQDRISRGRAGLLRGGSSYTNMFDGDARLALFTLAALGRERLFENVRGLGFLILFGLGPIRIMKVIGLSLWTWLSYVAKRLLSLVRPSKPHFTFLGPLLEIFNNIIFREVTTFSVMVDIYRGMPAIYASYTGYDEIAHHFGADSREAFRSLRSVDKQIRQIDRIRQLYLRRDYDLYILSDHGMTASVPFRRAYGQSLEQFIAGYTGTSVHWEEPGDETEGLSTARAYFLLEELRGLEARPHRPVPARMLRATRQQLEKRLLAISLQVDWDLDRRGDIAVQNSGSLSHIYFNVTPQPMDLSEIVLLYPGLVENLARHEGIGLVVGREGDEIMAMGQAGTLWIAATGQRVEGQNPLGALSNTDWAAEQLARVARFPHAGDLVLLGAWDGEQVVCFEEQVASHGGLGGPQHTPFILYPPGESLSARGIGNSEEIYVRLVRAYGSYG